MEQHVRQTTLEIGHTLDAVITREVDPVQITFIFIGQNAFGFWQLSVYLCYETLKHVSNFSELA